MVLFAFSYEPVVDHTMCIIVEVYQIEQGGRFVDT